MEIRKSEQSERRETMTEFRFVLNNALDISSAIRTGTLQDVYNCLMFMYNRDLKDNTNLLTRVIDETFNDQFFINLYEIRDFYIRLPIISKRGSDERCIQPLGKCLYILFNEIKHKKKQLSVDETEEHQEDFLSFIESECYSPDKMIIRIVRDLKENVQCYSKKHIFFELVDDLRTYDSLIFDNISIFIHDLKELSLDNVICNKNVKKMCCDCNNLFKSLRHILSDFVFFSSEVSTSDEDTAIVGKLLQQLS